MMSDLNLHVLMMLGLLGGLCVSACAENAVALRELAARRGVLIGAAVGKHIWRANPAYGAVLAREFNILTAENDMKWRAIHPERDRFDWSASDPYVDFAEAHGMQVRGHTLCWHAPFNPTWLEESGFTRVDLIGLLSNHIDTVVGRYRGRVAMWDVVNEAVADEAPHGLRSTIWSQTLGPDYLDLAFRAAHAADPGATLVYNDYGGEAECAKADAIYALVASMRARGVPVHAVGFQMHIVDIDAESFARNLARFAKLGVDLHITELDVRLPTPPDGEALRRQGEIYRKVLRTCLLQPACRVIQMWGISDAYSWIPAYFPGHGAALPLDADFQPKPAWLALREELAVQ